MTEPLARIEAALSRLGAEHEPPAGWEARVLAATVERKRRRWWVFPIPVAVLAMAVGAYWLVVIPRPSALQVATILTKTDGTTRRAAPTNDDSTPAITGDVLTVEVKDGGQYRALWIYRDRQLETHCPSDLRCRILDKTTTIELTLELIGKYDVVAVSSDSPIPEPKGVLQIDLDKAAKAHVAVKRAKLIDVK
jgi:hypothetical protein